MINTFSESLKASKVHKFPQFGFHEQLKFHAQIELSMKSLNDSGPDLSHHTECLEIKSL